MLAETTKASTAELERSRAVAIRPALLLALLLTFTVAKGIFWILVIAPLDAPDEPSHLNYIVQVREGYLLPVVDLVSPAGLKTPPSTPLDQNLRDYFARYDYKFFRSMPYESAQPPLYYWMEAVWTRPVGVSPDNLPALLTLARALSVLLGTGAVLGLWLACRWVIMSPGWLVWLAPVALTLNPEFSFTTATVSNDAGVLFWGAVLLATWAAGLRALRRNELMSGGRLALLAGAAGIITAAGVLTKLTFIATVPGTLIWLWWLARGPEAARTLVGRARLWVLASLGFAVTAALLVLPWAVRNMREYGEPTGARAIFNLIHNIYWQRMKFASDQLFSQFPPGDFVVRSFRSFWALFGWATVWLDDWVYWGLALFVGLSIFGLIVGAVQRGRKLVQTSQARLVLLAGLTCLLAFANYVAYNSLVEFQPHIRYTFVALAPAFLLLAVGLARGPWGGRTRGILAWFFVAALLGAHILSLVTLSAHTQYVLSVAK